jgi:hypothetical protein
MLPVVRSAPNKISSTAVMRLIPSESRVAFPTAEPIPKEPPSDTSILKSVVPEVTRLPSKSISLKISLV